MAIPKTIHWPTAPANRTYTLQVAAEDADQLQEALFSLLHSPDLSLTARMAVLSLAAQLVRERHA